VAVIIPNTVFEYTVDADGTFPQKRVDIPSFAEEIEASSISVPLVSVTIVDGNCRIEFATNANVPPGLTDAEILVLEGRVQAHTALASGEPHMIPYIWQVKNPVAGQAATAMKVMGFANIIDDYNLMRAAVPVGLNIRLKNPLTQGSLSIIIVKNGVATPRTKVLTSADGRKKLWLLNPGNLSYEKRDTIGIFYAASADMLPSADNEININIEMAWKTQ